MKDAPRSGPAVAALLALLHSASPARSLAEEAPRSDRTTYAIEHVVRISAKRPTIARVRWNLAGIDEIRRLRLEIDGKRFREFGGSGEIEHREHDLVWRPAGPYAHLEYEVQLRHRRAAGKGFDSYATKDWVITRAQDLFPATHVTFDLDVERHPRSRATVRFHLPEGWQAYTAMEPLDSRAFRPYATGCRLDRPKGWIALGRLEKLERTIAGMRVTVVKPRGTAFPSKPALDLYAGTLPTLVDLLRSAFPNLLLVSAPDPMWHGGLSGERSLYLHGERPLRTPDETSPPIHEAFHVLAPFHPGSDGHWLSEGLAEYYSLVLQHRARAIDDEALRHGLELWRRAAEWNRNIATANGLSITNNAAPFVLAAIDERLRTESRGSRSLDDVVRAISESDDRRLTTATFLRAAKRVTGSDLTPFVQRHVFAGAPPPLEALGESSTHAP